MHPRKFVFHTLILASFAAFSPSALSAATTFTIGFDSSADDPTSTTNVSTSSVSGGFLTGVASTGDPRLIWNTATVSSTPIVSKLGSETWATVVFRVRETDNDVSSTIVSPWTGTGVIVQLNNTETSSGALSALSYSAVSSGDGYFTVTADISNFTDDDIRYLRVDPIGGSSTSDNNAAGNTFEVDFIQLNAVPEPSAMLLGALGMLALLRRRRR